MCVLWSAELFAEMKSLGWHVDREWFRQPPHKFDDGAWNCIRRVAEKLRREIPPEVTLPNRRCMDGMLLYKKF